MRQRVFEAAFVAASFALFYVLFCLAAIVSE